MSKLQSESKTHIPESNSNSNSYELVFSDADCPEACLSWSNLTFTAKSTKILNGVTGYAKPRELLAIMGSSGSGKTSLLSILSRQLFPSSDISISGTVELNGQSLSSLNYQTYCHYVTQQDILLPTFTPRESLTFAARLKVRGSLEALNEKVENLLRKLNILKCADNVIGNEYIKGLSGGEKKRLCIGMEMISDPLILILDEPTSGLDSYTAKLIIRLLKEEAANGKTIVMTIHQPGQEIYESFHRLILMMAGNFVYQGPRKEAQRHFDRIGYVCPIKTLPQDHFMRVLNLKNTRELSEEDAEKIRFLCQNYNGTEEKMPTRSVLPYSYNEYHPGVLFQIKVLLNRCFLNAKRNPVLFRVKIGQAIAMGTILSLIFKDLGYDDVQVRDRLGLLYILTINTFIFGAYANSTSFPAERPIFLKDYKENIYGVIPYYFSKFLAELPTVIVFTLLYSLIMYFSCNLNRESPKHYFIFLGIQILLHIAGMSLGNLAGVIAPNFGTAAVLTLTITVPWLLFGGYFSNTRSLTTAFSWIKYISPLSRGYEGFILNEFDGLPIETDFNPITLLGFYGEIWQKVGALLLIIGVTVCFSITALKIKAVRASYS